jgi:hypothetical protein
MGIEKISDSTLFVPSYSELTIVQACDLSTTIGSFGPVQRGSVVEQIENPEKPLPGQGTDRERHIP